MYLKRNKSIEEFYAITVYLKYFRFEYEQIKVKQTNKGYICIWKKDLGRRSRNERTNIKFLNLFQQILKICNDIQKQPFSDLQDDDYRFQLGHFIFCRPTLFILIAAILYFQIISYVEIFLITKLVCLSFEIK